MFLVLFLFKRNQMEENGRAMQEPAVGNCTFGMLWLQTQTRMERLWVAGER